MKTKFFSHVAQLRRVDRAAGILIFGVFLLTAGTLRADVPQVHTRCGWFDNSSPGNATLADRDGEWTIGQQGGHQATGTWPNFKAGQWVRTGVGSYGYGCACMRVTVNADTQEIVEIQSSFSKPLSACRKDRALKEPENPLKGRR